MYILSGKLGEAMNAWLSIENEDLSWNEGSTQKIHRLFLSA